MAKLKDINNEGKMTRLQQLCSLLPKLSVSVLSPWQLEAFTLFPKLPIEIRLKIWGLTASEGKRYYELCTEICFRRRFGFGLQVNNTWINFGVDRFVITNEGYYNIHPNARLNYEQNTLKKIQHLLLIGFSTWRIEHGMNRIHWLLQLPKLREFTAVSRREDAESLMFVYYKDSNLDSRLLKRDLFLHNLKTEAMREGVEYLKRHGLETKQLRVEVNYDDSYDNKCLLWCGSQKLLQ
ncbi:hypothetical protein NA56DRAFT_660207 [Hyaloscypha hepaticicola]|uniref:2EXR domain-containing protein n=1 Tax=Hyaloscypha hepaticicola TaxID=2082293 RepID=A0A2J6Q0Y5_9HELO|nr:hypothetical protein NA56DRAFT_660207 [Hyaloscypha hepaticicola]